MHSGCGDWLYVVPTFDPDRCPEAAGPHYLPPGYQLTYNLDLAHGGQTVLSGATEDLVVDSLPAGAWLTDLGTHALACHLFPFSHMLFCWAGRTDRPVRSQSAAEFAGT